jgi:hypothetical protein
MCITSGTHRVMRFNSRSRNIGNGAVVLGPPPPIPPTCAGLGTNNAIYVWSVSHCHYHVRNFNTYVLLNTNATQVGTGLKQAFCLECTTRFRSKGRAGRQFSSLTQ